MQREKGGGVGEELQFAQAAYASAIYTHMLPQAIVRRLA